MTDWEAGLPGPWGRLWARWLSRSGVGLSRWEADGGAATELGRQERPSHDKLGQELLSGRNRGRGAGWSPTGHVMLGVSTERILSHRTRSDGPQEQRGEGGGQGQMWGMGM